MMALLLARKRWVVGGGRGGACSACVVSVQTPRQRLVHIRSLDNELPASYCTRSVSDSTNRSFTRCIPSSRSHQLYLCQYHIPSIHSFKIQSTSLSFNALHNQ